MYLEGASWVPAEFLAVFQSTTINIAIIKYSKAILSGVITALSVARRGNLSGKNKIRYEIPNPDTREVINPTHLLILDLKTFRVPMSSTAPSANLLRVQ